MPDPTSPQDLNRYSYCINNPLKYTDPTGHFWDTVFDLCSIAYDIYMCITDPSWANFSSLGADVVLTAIPFLPAGVGPIKTGLIHADDFLKAGKAIDRMDDVSGVKSLIGKADEYSGSRKLSDAADVSIDVGKNYTKNNFRNNLMKLTDSTPI